MPALLLLLSLLCPPGLAGTTGATTVSQDGLAMALRGLLREAAAGTVVVAMGSDAARAVEKEAASDGLAVTVRTASPVGDRATELKRARGTAACMVVVEATGTRSFGLRLECEAAAAPTAGAAPAADLRAFSFSKVVFRLEPGQAVGQSWVAAVPRDVRWATDLAASTGSTEIRALERLRAAGLPARGAEDLLFGQDRSAEAPLVLGGEVRQVQVEAAGTVLKRTNRVSLVVEWQLFDRKSQQVVSRISAHGVAEAEVLDNLLLDQAVLASVSALGRDPRFQAALAPVAAAPAVSFDGPLALPVCGAAPRTLPADLAPALGAVLPVHVDGGVGAGVLISSEGWVLTAAHVVEGSSQVMVALGEGGMRLPAQVSRVQPAADVALLKIPGSGYPCLPLSTAATAPVGTPVFAAGAPMGQALGVSVTQGIVSGWRRWQDGALLQTDASLSPGHSGGPLLGPDGTVLAVISFKLVADGVEGMGFGVPSAEALRALSVELGP